MADKCPHCGVGIGPLARECYKCGGQIEAEQQMMPAARKETPPMNFWMSIIFGLLGVLLSPLIWVFTLRFVPTASAICGMYLFSGIFGLGAFILGVQMLYKKDPRGWIGLVLGIISAILILLPILFVMTFSFGT